MKNVIPAVKGTVDFYPEVMALRIWLYDCIRQVSQSFGYQQYEAPILENLELYAAKSGEELVKKQSFVFEDRGGRLLAMRPELTPSLARMIAQRQTQLNFPLRWWSFGPFWRYERPQKGRTREFFQWNIDLIGVESPEADAEIATVGATLLEKLGLSSSEVRILVNNRSFVEDQLAGIGIEPDQRPQVVQLIDRRDKMSPDRWEAYARDSGLSPAQFDDLVTLLSDRQRWNQSPDLVRFFEAVAALGKSDYFEYDPEIVRGLDYYTGTVFEARDARRRFRTLFGGGRYDSLVADVGGDPLPATGFAMGDKAIVALLEKLGKLPSADDLAGAPVLVTLFDESTRLDTLALAAELRQAGINATTYPEPGRLGRQFKYADRLGCRATLVLGPEEIARNEVAVKNLISGEQRSVPRAELAEYVRKLQASRA